MSSTPETAAAEGGAEETKVAAAADDAKSEGWDSLHEAAMRRAMKREAESSARKLTEEDVTLKFCRINCRLLSRVSAKFPDIKALSSASAWFKLHCVVVTAEMAKEDKDFLGVEPDNDEIADAKRKAQRLYMHKWYEAMRPHYTRIMGEDDGVWADIDEGERKTLGMGRLRLSTKWDAMAEKERGLIFRAAHTMLIQCRILVGEDPPEKSALEKLMEEFKGVDELDGDTIRGMHSRLFSEIMKGDADIGAAIDRIMEDMGGIDEVFKKMSDPNENPLRRKTKKAKKQRKMMRGIMRDSLEAVMDMMMGESSSEGEDDEEGSDEEGSDEEGSDSDSDESEDQEEEADEGDAGGGDAAETVATATAAEVETEKAPKSRAGKKGKRSRRR